MVFDKEYLLKRVYEAEATLLDELPKNSDNSEAFRCLDAAIGKLETDDLECAVKEYEKGLNMLLKLYRGNSIGTNCVLVTLCTCLGLQYIALSHTKDFEGFKIANNKVGELQRLGLELLEDNNKLLKRQLKGFDAERYSDILNK